MGLLIGDLDGSERSRRFRPGESRPTILVELFFLKTWENQKKRGDYEKGENGGDEGRYYVVDIRVAGRKAPVFG